MVYIQLSEPIKSYNKAKIIKINFFESAQFGGDNSIAFNYIIYKDTSEGSEVLYDKFVDISDKEFMQKLRTKSYPSLSAFDGLCRVLLEYLIDNNYENGTLEVE